MRLYSDLKPAPADPILGLSVAFKQDPRPGKINLSVGVYADDQGRTPVLTCVKSAERRLIESESSKSYLPIEGAAAFGSMVRELLFGNDHAIISDNRARTAHTPGGTGALRLAADFIARNLKGRNIWVSKPTWANHTQIFDAAGLTVKQYPYYDETTRALDASRLIDTLGNIPAGDIVLLHACCHNPTGVDPTSREWQHIANIVEERSLIPFIDFAYQGFGDGLDEDAFGIRCVAKVAPELFIASSFSKNFGLYAERVGALTLVAADASDADVAMGNLRLCARTNYSNPPLHGEAIVCEILSDRTLRAEWESELRAMRDRISSMRDLFVATLKACGVSTDFSFLAAQKGMFSYSGLNRDQVNRLREEFAIYIVGDGRINVAGISPANVEPLCKAIAQVL